MIPEGKDASAVTPEVAARVREAVENWKREKKLTLKDIARGIGSKESTLSQVLGDKYAGNWRQVILDLDRWLDDQVKIDLAPKPASFVWTSVAREIEAIARGTIELKTIGLLYGPETSGLGKTTALQAIAAELPACIMITIDKVHASVSSILDMLGHHLRIGSGYGNARRYDEICKALNGTTRLLIVDQIHNLCGAKNDKPFYLLTDLHERTRDDKGGLPMLWAGTSDVVAYLKRGQAKGHEPLSQIRSRLGIIRDLTQRTRKGEGGGPVGSGDGQLFTIDEIRAIFGKNKMRLAPDAARYLLRLANLPDSGALRSCKNLVVMATTLYQSRHDVLTEELLRAAHRMLVTDESYNLLQAEIEQTGPRLAKVG